MARHHFVPQFLLRQWGSDGQLLAYRWIAKAGKVGASRVSVASACQIDDLNAFFGAPAGVRYAPERDYFTPKVDTPASAALAVIIKAGVNGLSASQRNSWAQFLVSLGVRTPETLRTMGPQEWRRAMRIVGAAGPRAIDAAEVRVAEWLKANSRALERNKPLEIAMDLSSDATKIGPVAAMAWRVRRLEQHKWLVGDRPLLTWPRMPYPCGIPLNHPNCLVVLPVTPSRVFFATPNPKTRAKINRMPVGKLARIINEETIWQSQEYVFAADRSLDGFIRLRLEGKARGNWKPSVI